MYIIQVKPGGQAGGGSFKRETAYVSNEEIGQSPIE